MPSTSIPSIEQIGLNNFYQFNIQTTGLNKYFYLSDYSLYNNSIKFNSSYLCSKYPFINSVVISSIDNSKKIIDYSSIIIGNDDNITGDIHANFPLFFEKKNKIHVPSKVEYALRRFVPKSLLRQVHPNFEVAIELCLLFTTQLTSTYFEIQEDSNSEGWKALKAEYLRDLLSIDPLTYKNIRTALEFNLKNGPIIHCDYLSEQGTKSFHYRLGANYIRKGIVTYELKTPEAQRLLNKRLLKSYGKAMENPICKNLTEFYSSITLPTISQITTEAKRLIKLEYHTKKGKRLTFLNKHKRSYFRNPEALSFVEDGIKIFQYLTDNGLMIPTQGSDESGGRVVDSFTLMPSWIRRLIKVDGVHHMECDYSCFHPNIAQSLYGGSQEYLTHDKIAQVSGVNTDLVKVEHLSFFNKTVWQMRQSPLFEYYNQHEPSMIANIIEEKNESKLKHKVTSRKMFEKEVSIMTDVITKLNKEHIYVGYVYDALFCHPANAERIKEVMDEVALKHGVKTTAKLKKAKKHNPIMEKIMEKEFDFNSLIKSSVQIEKSEDNLPIIKSDDLRIDAGAVNSIDWAKQEILELIQKGIILDFKDAIVDFGDGSTLKEKVLWFEEINNPRGKYITHRFVFGL